MEDKEIVKYILLHVKFAIDKEISEQVIQDEVRDYVYSLGLKSVTSNTDPTLTYDQMANFRNWVKQFMDEVITVTNQVISNLGNMQKKMQEVRVFREDFPEYVKINDPQEAIEFYNGLDKDWYTYNEAAKLIGISRQTLSKYAKNHEYGFSLSGEKAGVSKQQIYFYYRNQMCNN